MAMRLNRFGTSFAAFGVMFVTVALAADMTKLIQIAEGRRTTSESGVRALQKNAPGNLDDIRSVYAQATTANNEWVDAASTVAATEAVATAAGKAAATYVQWVAARNRALGEVLLEGPGAQQFERSTRQNLIDIATETRKLAKPKADVLTPLRWRSWAEIK